MLLERLRTFRGYSMERRRTRSTPRLYLPPLWSFYPLHSLSTGFSFAPCPNSSPTWLVIEFSFAFLGPFDERGHLLSYPTILTTAPPTLRSRSVVHSLLSCQRCCVLMYIPFVLCATPLFSLRTASVCYTHAGSMYVSCYLSCRGF